MFDHVAATVVLAVAALVLASLARLAIEMPLIFLLTLTLNAVLVLVGWRLGDNSWI